MFSKQSSKGFFKRASSWREKHSKQKSGNSGSTPKESRLHKASSLNDVSFQGSTRNPGVGGEASPVVGLSFNRIQLDDEFARDAATTSPETFYDSFERYEQLPPSGSRPTFQGHHLDDPVQTAQSNQDLQVSGQRRSSRTPEKRPISSKACVDCPASQIVRTNLFGVKFSGDGDQLGPKSGRFSTGSATRTSQIQSEAPNQCISPLQTATNHPGSAPRVGRPTFVKSPVFARHSIGSVVRTSQRKNDSSPKNCISCHGPVESPTKRAGIEGSSFFQRRGSVRSTTDGDASGSPSSSPNYSPHKQPTPTNQLQNPSNIFYAPDRQTTPTKPKISSPGQQFTPASMLKNPSTLPDGPVASAAGATRSSTKRLGASAQPTSAEGGSPESFTDYDVLREARRVLTSLQRDISQSLDVISSNAAFPGVVRRGSGWSTSASSEPVGEPGDLQTLESLPSSHETRLKIVEACQTRCLEYREMIKAIADSVLRETIRFDSSTVDAMASLYAAFVRLKANCSDFKEMCARGSGDDWAGSLSNEMTHFVQGLCLNTMQMQNEVYLERLENGFALIRAHCKLYRVMQTYSCLMED